MKKLDVIAAALVIVGALNWGLAGVFRLDLVATGIRHEVRRDLRAELDGIRAGGPFGAVPGADLEVRSSAGGSRQRQERPA